MAEYSAFSILKNALTGNRTGSRPGASQIPSPATTSSSSAAAGTGSPRPIILPRNTASPMSRCWRKAISAPAMSAATPRSYARTTCCRRIIRFYEHSMKLWENLSHELNYNVMFSQRGILNLAHTPAQLDDYVAARQRHAPRGRRRRAADARPDRPLYPGLDVSAIGAFPGPRRPAAAARRHGPPRRGRLGLCARRRPARRRHHRKLRSDRLHPGRRPRRRRRRRRAAKSAPRKSASPSPAPPAG